jgi:hypothetical protein
LDFTITKDFHDPWTFNGVQLGGLNSVADGNVISFQFRNALGAAINASGLIADSTGGSGTAPWAYDVVNDIWRYASDNGFVDPYVASLVGTLPGVSQLLANIDRSRGQDSLFNLDLTVSQRTPLQRFVLDVEYTSPQLIGILLPAFQELPSSVHGRFVLEGDPQATTFGLDNVVSASLPFADGVWTDLENFSLERDPITGVITSLGYGFRPITTASFVDGITFNFPLTISGTDTATGDSFEYQYTESVQSLTAVPEPSSLALAVCGAMGLLWLGRRRRAA